MLGKTLFTDKITTNLPNHCFSQVNILTSLFPQNRPPSHYTSLYLVEIVVYFLFLVPRRNPVEILCPLPPQFYTTDAVTNETVTRTLVLFSPVIIRTTVMWTMFIANIVLLVGALYTWFNDNKLRGVMLLKKLPSVKVPDKVLSKRSDLSFLMELVYVNRQRLQFVKLVYKE